VLWSSASILPPIVTSLAFLGRDYSAPESSRAFGAAYEAEPRTFFDLANEKHYSIAELAKLWKLSERTGEEWAAFAANCNLRDMGTHLCALPTGEHCPKGLICLGCAHAQPKKSAVPIFRRMLVSHERSRVAARSHSEPAGQIAAREMEIVEDQGSVAESGGIER
jgi:hypothetical protein